MGAKFLRWRRAARIDGVKLYRYAGPSSDGALTRPSGLVVELWAKHGGAWLTGVGEAVVPYDQVDTAWTEATDLAAQVIGAKLPTRFEATGPAEAIGELLSAGAAEEATSKAAAFAIETALLDLLARHLQPPTSTQSASDENPMPRLHTHRLLKRLPSSTPPDRLTRAIRDDSEAWAVRVVLTGDTDLDIAWLHHLIDIERDAGRSRPLWLLGGERSFEDAVDLVQRVATMLTSEDCQVKILLEEPLSKPRRGLTEGRSTAADSSPQPRLRRLQEAVDEALGASGDPLSDSAAVRVVAGVSVTSIAQLRRLLKGRLGALHLPVGNWNSLRMVSEAARAAKYVDGSMAVLLSAQQGSRITEAALAKFAELSPHIDAFIPHQEMDDWPSLLIDAPSGQAKGATSHGIDLAELARVATGVTEVPVRERAKTQPSANTYPDFLKSTGALRAQSTSAFEGEALRHGLRTRRIATHLFLAEPSDAKAVIGFHRASSSMTSIPAVAFTARKGVARKVIAERGLPVALGASFEADELDEAYQAGIDLGFPLVVKPGGGSGGSAVTTGITTSDALKEALDEVAASRHAHTGVVVERFVMGSDYRVLATADEVLSVVRRDPASVVGDGRRTVEELVVAANAARRQNPHLTGRLIALDSRVDSYLRRHGKTRDTVPRPGERVQLRAEANLHQGADTHEVLESTHASVLALAVSAVRAFPGLAYAGLDILMEDHGAPADNQSITIIEINTMPASELHRFPTFGVPRNVTSHLLRRVASSAGVVLADAADETAIKLCVVGRLRPSSYQGWLELNARLLDVECSSVELSSSEVTAVLRGPAHLVASLVHMAHEGPPGAVVSETLCEPMAEDDGATSIAPNAKSKPTMPTGDAMVAVKERVDRPDLGRRVTAARAAEAGSKCLEVIARERGLDVRRYAPDLLICSDGQHRVAFRGLAGPAIGKVAQYLCGNDGWLRRHLAGHGMPVLETRLVDGADSRPVSSVAQGMSFPLSVRLDDEKPAAAEAAHDIESLSERVRALRSRAARRNRCILLEQREGTQQLDVAVVGGSPVALDCSRAVGLSPEDDLARLALQTAAETLQALPGVAYGTVTLAVDPDSRSRNVLVDRAQPLLDAWALAGDAAVRAIAGAVLDYELKQAKK